MKKLYTSLLCILVIITSACSSKPTSIVVAPEILNQPANNYANNAVALDVVDERSSQHVVQIIKKDEAATLYPSQVALESIIDASLKTAYKAQKLNIVEQANKKISVSIVQALINVDQRLMNYDATNTIELMVTITNQEKTLNKRYKNKGTSEGALSADIAVLERDFNQQLGKLLAKVLNDKAIQEFIK